jgi:hypothetical protein
LRRKLTTPQFLVSLAPRPRDSAIKQHRTSRTYVRQRELISADDGTLVQAITDYLKAEADRIHWAASGRVHSSSFDSYENDLLAAWRSYRTRVTLGAASHPEADRGALLYADCSLHGATLDGVATPPHFVRGSFHSLSDRLVVGWHPRYEQLLGTDVGGRS